MGGVGVELLLCVLLVVTLAWIVGLYRISPGCGYSIDSRSSLTRSRWGTVLTPCAQSASFNLGSIRTSVVPIVFCAKSTTDLTAQGARFLKERPCTRLWRWMVYSRVTTSWSAERVLPPVCRYDNWPLVGSPFLRCSVPFSWERESRGGSEKNKVGRQGRLYAPCLEDVDVDEKRSERFGRFVWCRSVE